MPAAPDNVLPLAGRTRTEHHAPSHAAGRDAADDIDAMRRQGAALPDIAARYVRESGQRLAGARTAEERARAQAYANTGEAYVRALYQRERAEREAG